MDRQCASGDDPEVGGEVRREYENSPEYLRDILRYVVEIGASLRLQTDAETMLKQIVTVSCQALRFLYAAIYLEDGAGFFRVAATSGVNAAEENYLHDHPLPNKVVAQIIDDCYRISDSYFLPAEASIWQDRAFASYFIVVNPSSDICTAAMPTTLPESGVWHSEDLILVPLVSGDNQLLGFLTPDFPLNGLRPTRETMGLFELFANQAAIVIEGERLSSDLRAALCQARESERRKNNFLLTASHELRTPLTAIQGYLELLGEYGETLDETSRARFIQNARRGCDELVLLLSNVLDTTYLDVEKISFKVGPIYLEHSVQAILEMLEPIIVREKRQVEMQISADLLVLADELRLRQVLLNLLGNAFKYTPIGSRVALYAECIDAQHARERSIGGMTGQEEVGVVSGACVMLTVRDWGPGIAPSEQSLLFHKFTRLTAAQQGSQRGAGLGLYLCRQLIEAMDGWIWMESSGIDGEGTCFCLALPMI